MSRARPSLAKDRKGAMMVMGCFQSVFMIGALYYVAGVGEAVVVRERIQDAVDSGTFAAAAVEARGMNSVATTNVMMSAGLAVVAALQTIVDLATLGITVAAACATLFPPCAAIIPPLEVVRETAESIKVAVEEPLKRVVSTIDKVAKIIAIAVPSIASGKVYDLSIEVYGPRAGVSFTWPSFKELPIELLSLRQLCNKAAEEGLDIIMAPFDALPIPGRVLSPIRGALRGFARASAFQYCNALPAISLPSIPFPSFPRQIFTPEPRSATASLDMAAGIVSSLFSSDEGQMEIQDDAELGGEDFQVRVLVVGHQESAEETELGVQLALWGRGDDSGRVYRTLFEMGEVHFANAEYYYAGDEDREEWLVHTKWESRMRQFRLPEGGSIGDNPGGACRSWGGGPMCNRVDRVVELLGDLAIH